MELNRPALINILLGSSMLGPTDMSFSAPVL